MDKKLLLYDILHLVIPVFSCLGVAIISIDVLMFMLESGIIQRNVFSAIGSISIIFFFSFRVFYFFDYHISRMKKEYKTEVKNAKKKDKKDRQ